MTDRSEDAFRFEYAPGTIRFGSGAADALGEELTAEGVTNALVVTGRTVGDEDAVMDPIREGIGDRLHGVFAETTPDKRLDTAIDAAEAMALGGADGIVAVGGGSSLDVATVARIVVAGERTRADVREEFVESGTVTLPEAPLPPLVIVPTTLAGAELSQGAGISAMLDTGDTVSGGVSDPRLMPSAVVADPELYATTPPGVLTGSAMNGFDKGIETLYARAATPITDATAVRGLQLLVDGLPAMAEDTTDTTALSPVVQGLLLVQYGISRPDAGTLSVIHAFGHALRDVAGLQQGVAHAIIAPHAVEYVLGQVDDGRELLADGLRVETDGMDDDAVTAAVVDAIATVRNALDLPTALSAVDGLEREDLDAVAESTLDDRFMENGPADLEPTRADLEAVLEAAWD